MDKYEYKIKSEEIKELIAQREYVRAAEIADTIDWRRVKSVMMLCTISDLYKMNRRYEDSRDMLLLAYDRHPGGRTIVYALCELSIKTGEIPQAVEYCKEFVNIAPRDAGRYVLQYKIYEAQGVSLEERIEVLEELKKHDYREKWAYELAYLYHRIGLASKCVDECDEMIVWFGDGKYVIKAMELKMIHQPLTPDQQYKYDRRFAPVVEEVPVEEVSNEEATVIEEIPMDMSMGTEEEVSGSTAIWSGQDVAVAMEPLGIDTEATKRFPVEEINIQVKTLDPGNEYNTINLQAELAAGLKEVLENEKSNADKKITNAIMEPMMQTDNVDGEEVTKILTVPTTVEESEVATEEAERLIQEPTIIWNREEVLAGVEPIEPMEEAESSKEEAYQEELPLNEEKLIEVEKDTLVPIVEELSEQEFVTTGQQVMEQMRRETIEPPKEMAKVLSMEGDGQLTFLLEEKNAIEQQITGQLSIADIMAEWERMKKELEEKGKEKVRQHVKANTGQMFTEFEASVRDGLLEQLEGGRSMEAVMAEAEGRSLDEEELPVPESLLEDEEEPAPEDYEGISYEEAIDAVEEILTAEDVVEELEEIQEFTEEATEESDEELDIEVAEEDFEEFEAEETEEFAEELEAEETGEPVEELEAEEAEEFAEELEAEDTEEPVEDSEVEDTEKVEEASEIEETVEETAKVRKLTREERELFAPFIQGRSSREQLVKVLDSISMAAYTGNVIVTGAEGLDTLGLARSIVQDVQGTDSNFSGKTAKISGEALNKRNVNEILGGLENGALIIQRAHNMNEKTVEELYKALQQENTGIIVVLEGVRKLMDAFLAKNAKLANSFTARMDMEALSDATLVAFCKKYAKENEFVLDELAILALHQIITDRQTSDHAVTIMEVKEIMDDAMDSASRKSVGHFIDILTGKRYDEEDMIIIQEKDLM
ncbi:MAG: hypothetical protein IKK33_10710 [Lachnospiraceae bacterium]|nr:hypothetical protein [Lachnospiraceae bacterium]